MNPEMLFDLEIETNMDFTDPEIWRDGTAMYALGELAAVAVEAIDEHTGLDALVVVKFPIE